MIVNKKKVLYYVQPYFLDCCIEIIKELFSQVELHLVIEITDASKHSTIIDIDNIDNYGVIENMNDVLESERLGKIIPYTSQCHSVKFIFFKNKSSFSPLNLIEGIKLINYIKINGIEIVHFDGQSARLCWILPMLIKKKLVLTIHDPITHSGEFSWKSSIVRKIYSHIGSYIFFYSEFALEQYKRVNSRSTKALQSIKLKPYTFISRFGVTTNDESKFILFFGRISYYKGIDILLKSINIVVDIFPNEYFLIAGDFSGKTELVQEIKKNKNIVLVNKHLEIKELATILSRSKFVVCPYRDATQSGVLMTSFAMNKPVIASNVGAFPEYIKHDFNGLLSSPNHIDIANNILYALENKRYEVMGDNIKEQNKNIDLNQDKLIEAYQ